MKSRTDRVASFVVALFLVGFLCLLNYYGYVLLPFWTDETFFLQPAQNLAEGKGMGTPALDDLLPQISQRTYWQPPVYFLVLSAWGRLLGFDVMSSRWFSRFCAVLVLLMLWFLARQWGIGTQLALICVFWTGLDLTFQYNANLGRMDILNVLWLMASLLAFTAYERSGREWQAGVAGVFGALATLTHFIAIPAVLTLGAILAWRRQRKALVWFLLPIVVGWALWLAYAAQDWQSWFGQLRLQFARKIGSGFDVAFLHLLFLQSLFPLYGVFPTNSLPIWFGLIVATFLAWLRRHFSFESWQVALFLSTFFSSALGGEVWYVGWWTPFGYLLLSLWLHNILLRFNQRALVSMLCVFVIGWQSFKIGQAVSSIPTLKRDIDRFFAEVPKVLPFGSIVLLHCVPDPFPLLQNERPDLKLVQISPTPMLSEALSRLQNEANFFIGITEWVEGRGLNLPEPWMEWRFQVRKVIWIARIYKLHETPLRSASPNNKAKPTHNVNCNDKRGLKTERKSNEAGRQREFGFVKKGQKG